MKDKDFEETAQQLAKKILEVNSVPHQILGNVTSTTDTVDAITMDDVKKTTDYLETIKPAVIIDKMKMCKKHFRAIEKAIEKIDRENCLGTLYGIPIIVQPYLKKVRIYWKVNSKFYKNKE